jgi:riboflavin kinase/FMN adenylyltransferase
MNVSHAPGELEPKPRAVAIGTFDGVHVGHQAVVSAADVPGLAHTVVTFHPHPREVLGYGVELLSTLERRLELLERLGVEDVLVVEFTPDVAALAPEEFADAYVRRTGATVVAAGEAFRFGTGRSGDLTVLQRLGLETRVVPIVPGVSSTRIRQLVAEGEVREAATLLGRPVEVEGIVVSGDARGGTLGFSCRSSGSTPARPAVIVRRPRSASIRTTGAPSDASRHSCSTSRETSTASV